jgi:hypothetical protein
LLFAVEKALSLIMTGGVHKRLHVSEKNFNLPTLKTGEAGFQI